MSTLSAGTGPGPGRINVSLRMTPEVFLLKLRGTARVLAQRVRRTVQESVMASGVETLQLTEQICFWQIAGAHT